MRTQEELSGSRVLITGGAGFIGSHLADALLARGASVVVIDDLCTGSAKNLDPRATLYRINTTDKAGVTHVFEKERPQLIYQLAANTNVPLSVKDPIYDFGTLQGALNVIDACRHFGGVEKVVYVSSGFIYGNTRNKPIKESEPFNPISPYSITKKTIENYLAFYREVYRVPYVVLRPATVYGPRQMHGAMADYIRKLAAGSQAEIYGDGSKTRDYTYVADAVAAMLLVLGAPDDLEDPVFNLGTGVETSLNDLYFAIATLLGKRAEPIYRPRRPGELENYSLDSSRLKQRLGWNNAYSLDDGLRETLRFWGHI
jgi:UDP-glucose 4-epimerase